MRRTAAKRWRRSACAGAGGTRRPPPTPPRQPAPPPLPPPPPPPPPTRAVIPRPASRLSSPTAARPSPPRSPAPAECAESARMLAGSRLLRQLVEPMGAGKTFGTLQGGPTGSKYSAMKGAAQSSDNVDTSSGGVTPRRPAAAAQRPAASGGGLVSSRCVSIYILACGAPGCRCHLSAARFF